MEAYYQKNVAGICCPLPAKTVTLFNTKTYDFPPGDSPSYGLYRYVPRNRVWFLKFSVFK